METTAAVILPVSSIGSAIGKARRLRLQPTTTAPAWQISPCGAKHPILGNKHHIQRDIRRRRWSVGPDGQARPIGA